MNEIERLVELFKDFPGIGPRQAKRFVYFLLHKNESYVSELAEHIVDVRKTVHTCQSCFRFFPNTTQKICDVCRNENRDKTSLMLVSHDIDFENVEKTGSYNGYYFILGGIIPILEKNPEKRIRQKELLQSVKKRVADGLSEIIIALNYNPEGENTLSYLKEILSTFGIKISTLGRGLSTGIELEYSDSETIKNALKNRQ